MAYLFETTGTSMGVESWGPHVPIAYPIDPRSPTKRPELGPGKWVGAHVRGHLVRTLSMDIFGPRAQDLGWV